MSGPALKILMTGAELDPLIKVGGLGDVLGSLPKALEKLGVDVRIIIPFYGSISAKKYKIKLHKKNVKTELDKGYTYFDLYHSQLPGSKIKIYLIKHKFFDHQAIYLGRRLYRSGSVYSRGIGDVERFVFFSKAVVSSLRVS